MHSAHGSSREGATRRDFLKRLGTGTAAAPFFVRRLLSAPPNGILRLASFGADGMAFYTLQGIARHPSVRLVAVAEVDSTRLDKVRRRYPDGGFQVYSDWRRMLDRERKNIDIVCVGTPDHMHAAQVMASLQRGYPVYGQKPLTHDVYEARKLAEEARRRRLVTQMGIQIHSTAEYRTAVNLVQNGAIGKIKEVHAWSEKKWGDPSPVPGRTDPVPPTLDWNQWLGTAASRPYIEHYYHPSEWRKRLDFGTGTFGDMGCHIYDPIFESLGLSAPLSVRSDGPAPTEHNWAINDVVRYVFPGTRFAEGKTVQVTWYDGDERPPAEVLQAAGAPAKLPGQGSIFLGTKGAMLLPHVGMPVLLPESDFRDYPVPKIEPVNHYFQFVDAVLGKATASVPFEYAGPLTEAVLLGSVATRFPHTTLEWNGAKLRFTRNAEANRFLRRKYRKGWKVKDL